MWTNQKKLDRKQKPTARNFRRSQILPLRNFAVLASASLCPSAIQRAMNASQIDGQGPSKKRKRKTPLPDNGEEAEAPGKAPNGNAKPRELVKADQLAWKKVSLLNDEFDDFEEIEGVDVEYVGG